MNGSDTVTLEELTVTLEELAVRLVPVAFKRWRALSEILSGARDRSLRHIKNQDRREVAVRRPWRRRLIERAKLDDWLLPKGDHGQTGTGSLRAKLRATEDLKTRQKLVVEEARRRARAEVREQSRTRLERARDQLGRSVLTAVSDALRAAGTRVSGTEVRQTVGGVVLSERAEIAPDRLVHAHIDILAGSLTEGGRQWRQVTVHLGQMPAGGGPLVASTKESALQATDEAIVAWMLDKQMELKGKAEKHGRDKLVRLAMKHFDAKQDAVRQAWDGRGHARKRK